MNRNRKQYDQYQSVFPSPQSSVLSPFSSVLSPQSSVLRPQSFFLRPQSLERGFSLIELIITIIILGFSSLIIIPFFQATLHSPDPMIRERAIALGQAMMDEVLAKKWDENTPAGGGPVCTTESPNQATRPSLVDACITSASAVLSTEGGPEGASGRTNWDDVDDYNGVNEASGSLKDQNNNAIGLNGYSRTVAVGYIASNTDPITISTAFVGGTTDTKLIKVTVTSPRGEAFNFVAVSCNY